jgi:hypothetical protein
MIKMSQAALHYTIHAHEDTPTPEAAEESADRLLRRANDYHRRMAQREPPDSSSSPSPSRSNHLLAHFVHMPGHIFHLVGRLDDAHDAFKGATQLVSVRRRVFHPLRLHCHCHLLLLLACFRLSLIIMIPTFLHLAVLGGAASLELGLLAQHRVRRLQPVRGRSPRRSRRHRSRRRRRRGEGRAPVRTTHH